MPFKQEEYLNNCLKTNNIAGFFKAIARWGIVPEKKQNPFNRLKGEWEHGNVSHEFVQRLEVFMQDLDYNTHFDDEITTKTTKKQQDMGNKTEVKGNGNIVIQDVTNGTVNVNTPSPQKNDTPPKEEQPQPSKKNWWDKLVQILTLVIPLLALTSSPWWIQFIIPSAKPIPATKTIIGTLVDTQVPPQPVRNVSRVYLVLPDGKGNKDTEVDSNGGFEFQNISVPDDTRSIKLYIDVQGKGKKYVTETLNANDLKENTLNLREVEVR